jgi:molybdopterin synthase sulfur carrier subunit
MAAGANLDVTFYAGLAKIFGTERRQVTLTGKPGLRELLDMLCDTKDRRDRIFDDQGRLRQDVTILRNGRNVAFLGGLETELDPGDQIVLFPPVYGG